MTDKDLLTLFSHSNRFLPSAEMTNSCNEKIGGLMEPEMMEYRRFRLN